MVAVLVVVRVVDDNRAHSVVGQSSSLPHDRSSGATPMSGSSLSRPSLLFWAVLALALLFGVGGDLSAASPSEAGPASLATFAVTVTRTRVVQVAACAMAFALFIIMRSCNKN